MGNLRNCSYDRDQLFGNMKEIEMIDIPMVKDGERYCHGPFLVALRDVGARWNP